MSVGGAQDDLPPEGFSKRGRQRNPPRRSPRPGRLFRLHQQQVHITPRLTHNLLHACLFCTICFVMLPSTHLYVLPYVLPFASTTTGCAVAGNQDSLAAP